MAILLAILAGLASIANFMYLSNTVLQVGLTVLAFSTLFLYRGRRTRRSYTDDGTRLFTLGFAICFVSFIGSGAILVAYILHLT